MPKRLHRQHNETLGGLQDSKEESDDNLNQQSPMTQERARQEFLLHLYDQLCNEINRHILVTWQSVGLILGAFALFALAEKNIIPVDWAVSLVLLMDVWALRHLQDASSWYNRNLAMIANIERQFLKKEDLRNIHYYFGKHRPENRMISHLRIQVMLTVAIGLLILTYHFSTRVWDTLSAKAQVDIAKLLPYLIAVVSGLLFRHHCRKDREKYAEFLENSPGLTIDTTGIKYAVGHGFKTQPVCLASRVWHWILRRIS